MSEENGRLLFYKQIAEYINTNPYNVKWLIRNKKLPPNPDPVLRNIYEDMNGYGWFENSADASYPHDLKNYLNKTLSIIHSLEEKIRNPKKRYLNLYHQNRDTCWWYPTYFGLQTLINNYASYIANDIIETNKTTDKKIQEAYLSNAKNDIINNCVISPLLRRMLKNAIPFTPYYDHEIIKNYGLEFVDRYGKMQIGTAGDANSAISSFINSFILNYCDIDPHDENYLFTFLGHLKYNGAQFIHNIGQCGFTNYTLRGENIENVQVIILRSGSTGRDAYGHYAAILRINNSYDFVYIEALTNRITWHYIQCIGRKEGEITFNTFPTISPNGLLDYYNGLE